MSSPNYGLEFHHFVNINIASIHETVKKIEFLVIQINLDIVKRTNAMEGLLIFVLLMFHILLLQVSISQLISFCAFKTKLLFIVFEFNR